MGGRRQLTWLIYTRGRGYNDTGETREENDETETGSEPNNNSDSNPDLEVDGRSKVVQSRSISVLAGQHLQLKYEIYGCKLWGWKINKSFP